MPDECKCICCPRDLRAVQQICLFVQLDLQMLEDRLTATRQEIILPENVGAIWNGESAPTVETEIHGALGVVLDDHLPELIELLHRAAVATPRKVQAAWRRLKAGKRTYLEVGHGPRRGPQRKSTAEPLPYLTT